MRKIDTRSDVVPRPKLDFVFPATDVLISADGELVVALSRVDGRFAVQRGGMCIVGRVDIPLTAEQAKSLAA